MVQRTWSLISLLAVAVSTPAFAQVGGPTDTELKAAYCVPIVKAHIANVAQVRAQVDALPASDNKVQMLAQLDAYSAGLRSDFDRLSAYLVPIFISLTYGFDEPRKISALDAFTAAQNRGKQDSDDAIQAASTCAARCGAEQTCQHTCLKEMPAVARVSGCSDLRWLPL